MSNYKTVYQTNDSGEFVGETISYESPLEPGVFLIPAKCTELKPPAEVAGKTRTLINGKWKQITPVPTAVVETVLSQEQLITQLTAEVSRILDAAAVNLGYDSISTAITYAEEPAVPKFQTEGKALRAWRSLVWQKFYEILDEVKSATRTLPSISEISSLLPSFVL